MNDYANWSEVEKILKSNGFDLAQPDTAVLVREIKDYANACGAEGYEDGKKDGEGDTEQAVADALEALRSEILADLKTFVDLSKTDPDSAAVYFHRATGRHLFEVQQPCLL